LDLVGQRYQELEVAAEERRRAALLLCHNVVGDVEVLVEQCGVCEAVPPVVRRPQDPSTDSRVHQSLATHYH
jgi:hypothetical protein